MEPSENEQRIKPISELRAYSELLDTVKPNEPVILTKNGYGKYAVIDIADFKKYQELLFASKMMQVADEAREGKKYSWSDIKRELQN
ncbi:type II toxin-antitoxin system prevent-host-death family antitoxin [Levilactobacillus enshiensis]|uniref:type II toxin-antitoxin system prevent-host-death family antitoxin n=1 Tax=Levilactobacillus enshiensis TaxID=2590213 RepID=UPI00117B71CC|nr:type II toxin-antitoxin system prevent-host-death family antitoxin [Levilactobacillus enshiensis]